ncbi:hypothetical protein ER308_08350 [Egibacter rhizosphaerae]|uniref:Gamma-glutamyltransferase n=1 Tax=Egibacter rhizosphaerae TaxID=1670831 RepID=A0A411YEB8_9ACTN|nr:gamma-glutamyltransferase [Egibacter rhizosphaerae]QBI19559.1 hypothetical protein ER308_08350 [Egibacter rhizosphaerae]
MALALAALACDPDAGEEEAEPEAPVEDEEPEPPAEDPDEGDAGAEADDPDDPEDGDEPDGDHPEDPRDEEDDEPEEQGPGEFAVSAGHPRAVDAGMEVLEAGGSAVDAAVAAAYAVSVVEPFASGIGGGGQTLVAAPGESPQAYDYREVVPQDGQVPESGAGIPGFVAGMEALHDEYGEVSWEELLDPAVELAEGAETSGLLADQLQGASGRLPVGELGHLYPGGQALAAGEPLVQEELASTLRQLRDEGADTFYEGVLAEQLAGSVAGIDLASLGAYEVQRSEPPSGEFGGYEVVGAAPPLPGSTLIQQLQIAEAAGVADVDPASADAMHTTAMAWRAARSHIEWDLGDPDFVDVPTEVHTDRGRNEAIAETVPADGLLPIDPGSPRGGVDPNTTHVTVVGPDGQLVSMTNTLTNFWGSSQYASGYFVNNQLARFSIGQSDANNPEPGRRSVSWSLPAMVLDEDGDPVLGIGTPGGERIPNVLTQLLARWALHGQSLQEAIDAPRYHLEGARLQVEQPLGGGVGDDLGARGYEGFDQQPALYFGSVQALEVGEDGISGARDGRREADWRADSP